MLALQRLLHRQWLARIQQEAAEREFGEAVFKFWRDRYVAVLCAHIRICWECRQAGIPDDETHHTPDWCNAAVQVLTIGDLELQDEFLRAEPEQKDAIVKAVLEDGGVTRMDGFFAELPPL